MMYIGINSFILGKQYVLHPRLPTDVDDCPADTDFSNLMNITNSTVPDLWVNEQYSKNNCKKINE